MVKIIAKNMPKPALLALFSLIVILLLMNSAYAARQALEFSDVDVKVGSRTSKNVKNGQTINEEAEPGDNVEFRIEVKNNFTSEEKLDIDDIELEVTVEGIDDGDDIDLDAKRFDLRQGNDKRVTVKFQVPLEVEEDTFDVEIIADGEDENGTDQRVAMKIKLEVEKENHKIVITRNTLSPAEVSCSRRNVQLGTSVINIGNEDEEDVTLHVLNSELGIDIKQNIGELTAEPNEDESKFSNSYSLSIPNDAEAGSYPVTLRVLFNEDREKEEETATLTVSDCVTKKQETKTEEEDEESAEVVSVTGKTTADTEDTTSETEELPEGTVTSEESFFKSNVFVGGVIAAEVIAVVIGIVLVVSLFRRKG